jgi:multidrug efflux pump subunit AcrA (membrane-fusion protein)
MKGGFMMNQTSSTHLMKVPAPLPVPETGPPDALALVQPALVITTHDALLQPTRLPRAPIGKRVRWYHFALMIVLLGGSSVYLANLLKTAPSESHQAQPTEVEEVISAARAPLELCLVEHGNIESADTLELGNPLKTASVKLESMLPFGTKVKKGQVVAKFDLSALQPAFTEQTQKLEAAQMKLRDAQDALDSLKNKQESDLAAAQLQVQLAHMDYDRYITEEKQVELTERRGALAMAERDLHEAEEKLEYYRTFHKRGFITSEQLKAKETEVSKSRFNLNQSQARLKIFEKYQMPKQETQLKAAVDDMQRALCRLKKTNTQALAKAETEIKTNAYLVKTETEKWNGLKTQLALNELKAPRDGVLTAPLVQDPAKPRPTVGSVLAPEQVIYLMPDFDKLSISVRLDEEEYQQVHRGQNARVILEGEVTPTIAATVDKIDFQVESTMAKGETSPHDYVCRVRLGAASMLHAYLRLGQRAKVEILVGKVPDAIQIPAPAVTEKEGKHYAFVKRESRIEPREIRVGGSDGKNLEVREGIGVGEQVLLHHKPKDAELMASRSGQQTTP